MKRNSVKVNHALSCIMHHCIIALACGANKMNATADQSLNEHDFIQHVDLLQRANG